MRLPALVLTLTCACAAQDFLVKPYLQLGNSPRLANDEKMLLLWHTRDENAGFSVQVKTAEASDWTKPVKAGSRRITVRGVESHRVWIAPLTKLKPGEEFDYRVLKGDQPVFQARARARKPAAQPHRFVLFGDCGQNSPAQKAIAYQTHLAKPDFVFLAGDIVYGRGRIAEYRSNYFPIYNADDVSPALGAPLMRSTLFVAAPGNHDMFPDLRAFPDGMAYFYYWNQPLNGPQLSPGSPNTPIPAADEGTQRDFIANAGETYPRMTNFSFDYGNAHWTVLDSNHYVDWRDSGLRNWVASDLKAARGAAWRFVAFHHPGMSSSKTHFADQQMRLLSDLFEKAEVDLVFAGHVHNYQRSYPLYFSPAKGSGPRGRVEGDWRVDKEYDGVTRTKPKGPIYIVSGSGGAQLYDPDQQDNPASWQPFTVKFISQLHSLTQVDVDAERLTVRQIDLNGREVDRFVVTR
ncbi:MAG: metallophosphoesterase [Acidobacteria bacterium]|nr:metallophosphoesterase [Acidobacteriota bacterium]